MNKNETIQTRAGVTTNWCKYVSTASTSRWHHILIFHIAVEEAFALLQPAAHAEINLLQRQA